MQRRGRGWRWRGWIRSVLGWCGWWWWWYWGRRGCWLFLRDWLWHRSDCCWCCDGGWGWLRVVFWCFMEFWHEVRLEGNDGEVREPGGLC